MSLALFEAKKPPVDPSTLKHRDLLSGDFWRQIPRYADVDEATFLDHRWQAKNTITNTKKLLEALQGLVNEAFLEDVSAGFKKAPMQVRISPYLMSLIDWSAPETDPLRIQFLPMASRFLPDHPKLGLDSLGEQADAPTPGLTHRYIDKALFLVIDTCPVYCRFCTRSYAVGSDTESVDKVSLKPTPDRWERALAYIASRPELEDIVISGGDVYQMRADWLSQLGHRLLDIDHIRRIRFATKGLAVMPQKILTDDEWFKAIVGVNDRARAEGKDVALHTHFNTAREITEHSQRALNRLHGAGLVVRNQSVLLRGVNDTFEKMGLLVKRLSYINAHPYYVYIHDLVQGGEEMRTTLQTAIDLEKQVRGITAGFNTPTFVVDAPGGGGKRDAHSFEAYDRASGISRFTAPSVKAGQSFFYFDPIDLLSEDAQARWRDPTEVKRMMASIEG
ncbi:KamA family radical SAM protein [Myxococcota bacterium]|nr:KamA family radical SAM protein [Myxococcota bacterium]MBU1431259.1 KamA family radical SAM protein [Myxococcota bacterium]MBU1898052.1 KamA family radical SAM protein [Myxococcota bacterium]